MLKSVIRKHLRWVLLGLFGVGMVSMVGSYADMNTDSTMSNANKQETVTFLNGHIFAPMVKVGGDLSKRSPSKVAGNVNVLMPFLPVGNNLNLLGYVSGNMNYYKGRNYIYSGTMGARYMVPTMPMIAGGYVAFDSYKADQDNNAKYSRLTVGAEGWFQKYYGGLNGYYLLNQESSFTLNGEPSIVKHGSDYFASYNQSRARSVNGFELTGGYNVVEGFNVYGGVRFFMAADKAESTKSAVGPYAKVMYTFDFTQQHVYMTQAEFTGEIAYDEINKTYSLIGIRFQFGYGIPYTSGFAHHMIEDPIRQVEFTTYNFSTHGETKLNNYDIVDTGDGLKNKIGKGNIPNIYVLGNVDIDDTLNVDHKVTVYGDYYTWNHDGKTYKIPLHGGIKMTKSHSMFNLKNHADLTLKGLTLDLYHQKIPNTPPEELPGDAVPLFMVEDNVDWNITYDTVTVPNTYYAFAMQIRGGKGHLSIVNSTFDHIANTMKNSDTHDYNQYGVIQVYDGGTLTVDHIVNNTFTMDNAYYINYDYNGYNAIGFATGWGNAPNSKGNDLKASNIFVYDIRENTFNNMGLYFHSDVATDAQTKPSKVVVGNIMQNTFVGGKGITLSFTSDVGHVGAIFYPSTMEVGNIIDNSISTQSQAISLDASYGGFLTIGDINKNHLTVTAGSDINSPVAISMDSGDTGYFKINNIKDNIITVTRTAKIDNNNQSESSIAGVAFESSVADLSINGDISGNIFNINAIYVQADSVSPALSFIAGNGGGTLTIKGDITKNVFNVDNATGIVIGAEGSAVTISTVNVANITENIFNVKGTVNPAAVEREIKTARGILLTGIRFRGGISSSNAINVNSISNNTFNSTGYADNIGIVNINGEIVNITDPGDFMNGVGPSIANTFTVNSITNNTFNSAGKALWFHLEGQGDIINISQFTNNTFNVATGAAGYSVFENRTSTRPDVAAVVDGTTSITFYHDAGQTNLYDTNAGMTYDITKDGGSSVNYNAAILTDHH